MNYNFKHIKLSDWHYFKYGVVYIRYKDFGENLPDPCFGIKGGDIRYLFKVNFYSL